MVQVGEFMPDGILYHTDPQTRVLQVLSIRSLFANKRVVLVGLPGAFTPACSTEHLPGFIAKAPMLHAKGVTNIYCVSVNDPFVVYEWSKTFPNSNRIKFLADGSATYTKELGLDMDLTEYGMGVRSRRYVLFVDNMVVRRKMVEESGELTGEAPRAPVYVDDLLNLFI